MMGVGSTQQPDTIRTAGASISVPPIAHGTVVLLLGRLVVLIDPARISQCGGSCLPSFDMVNQRIKKAQRSSTGFLLDPARSPM
jgi:hypothetical protein